MVATLAQAASAAYYLESQRSFRHPNEYYTAGEEPDGVWFNPKGLFGLADGGKVDSSDFHRLYNGFAPNTGGKLTQNAGSERRSAGLDLTFSADKSVSALWAVADPELRSEIEQAHNDAARVALEETVLRHCAYTRIRNRDGEIEVLPADISAAMFQHGTSRDNDPAAAYSLRDLQCRPDTPGRQVPGAAPAPGLHLDEGGGGCLPQCIGLEPARTPRHPHGTVRQGWRVHADRRDTGGPDRTLVEAPRGDYRSGPGDGLYGRGQRAACSSGEQDHAGRQVAGQRPGDPPPALARRGGGLYRARGADRLASGQGGRDYPRADTRSDGGAGRPSVPSHARGSGLPPAGHRRAGRQRHRRAC